MNHILKKLLLVLSIFFITCEDLEIDSIPPTVNFTNIQENSTLTNAFEISVKADDDKAIKEVQLFIDGVLKATLREQSTSTYNFLLDTDEYDNGNYQIIAKAVDKSNNETNSAAINVKFMNYRTLEIFNDSAVNVGYYYDDTLIEICLTGDTIFLDLPKKTDVEFTLYAEGTCNIQMHWWQNDVLNLNEDEEYRIFMPNTAFALFTRNSMEEAIDKIEVNGVTCDQDISSGQENFNSYFATVPGENYIKWYNKEGRYYYYDDTTDYPVPFRPLNASNPDENIYVFAELQPMSNGKIYPPSTIDLKSNTKTQTLFNHNAKNQTNISYLRGGVEKIK